jgi:hypothetical protein
MTKRMAVLTDEEIETEEREADAKALAAKLIKVLQGYTGDTAVIAISIVLRRIVQAD